MRHLKKKHKLGVKTAHRSALLANLGVALITHGRIKTTLSKAKALRPFLEKVITLAKKAHQVEDPSRKLHFYRQAEAKLRDAGATSLLFNEKVEEFLQRDGGYTRIYKLVPRKGDAASMALIELVPADDEGYSKRRTRKSAPKAAKAEEGSQEVAEEAGTDSPEASSQAEEPAEVEDNELSGEATPGEVSPTEETGDDAPEKKD